MISLDPDQTLLFNIGVDVFSFAVVAILFINCLKSAADTQDMRLFRRTQAMIMVTLAADIGMWCVNGVPGAAARSAGYWINVLYLLGQLLVVVGWLRYVRYRISGKRFSKRARLAVTISFLAMGACVASSPWTGWCFYLDEANYYHRGALSAPLSIVVLGYLLAASATALIRRKREVLADRKRECLVLAYFAIPPLLGGGVQTLLYGCSLLWPCAALSILLIFINLEELAVSRDSLTGLNNRGYLDRYLHAYDDAPPDRTVSLIMLDVNSFKDINDRFGHETGDAALAETAGVLKSAFGQTSALLARYGGDEFVVVLPEGCGCTPQSALEDIRARFRALNESGRLPYALSVSMGCAVCAPSGSDRIGAMLREADEKMYQDKKNYHGVPQAHAHQ